MGHHLEAATNLLFPEGNAPVGNIKFFRGHNRDVTAEQLAEQVTRANSQIEAGDAIRVDNVDGDLAA